MKKNVADKINDLILDIRTDLKSKDECSTEETMEKINARLEAIYQAKIKRNDVVQL